MKAAILVILLVFVLTINTDMAYANASDDFGNVGAKLCQIVSAITGRVGRAIATIAVVFLGIGAFFGKVTWGLAVAVSVGIFAIFGAGTIIGQFGAANNGNC
jgi:type IV secretory pathway VirB2 component (pilin)